MAKKAEKMEYAEGTKCLACGFPAGAPGEIPVIKYRDADAEEPVQPYQDGTKPCNDPCHGG